MFPDTPITTLLMLAYTDKKLKFVIYITIFIMSQQLLIDSVIGPRLLEVHMTACLLI